MAECDLHVVLGLTLLYHAVRFALLVQQRLENRYVLASALVLQEHRFQPLHRFALQDVRRFQSRVALPGLLQADHLLHRILIPRLIFARLASHPVYYFLLLNQWLPLIRTPLIVCRLLLVHAWRAAYKNSTALVPLLHLDEA